MNVTAFADASAIVMVMSLLMVHYGLSMIVSAKCFAFISVYSLTHKSKSTVQNPMLPTSWQHIKQHSRY